MNILEIIFLILSAIALICIIWLASQALKAVL
jgi:hypothetical protein